jgi:hypothetical protein
MTWSTYGLQAMGYPDPGLPWRLPDLSALFDKNMLNVGLDRFSGNASIGPNAGAHDVQQWLNLVRLTDKSIRCFEAARHHLAEYSANAHEGRVSSFYLAVDDLESTVSATHRAVLASAALQPAVAVGLATPTERQADLLRRVRNRVEHIDERVARRQQRSQPIHLHYLLPAPTRVIIDGLELPHRDLASCIRKMYGNVEKVRGRSH